MLPLLALRAHGVVATGNALASKDELAEIERRLADAVEKQEAILKLAEKQLTKDALQRILDEAVEKTVRELPPPAAPPLVPPALAPPPVASPPQAPPPPPTLPSPNPTPADDNTQPAKKDGQNAFLSQIQAGKTLKKSGSEFKARAGPTWPVWGA